LQLVEQMVQGGGGGGGGGGVGGGGGGSGFGIRFADGVAEALVREAAHLETGYAGGAR
jgi:hypothetical protein